MNLESSSVSELEQLRRKKEQEYRAICQLHAWDPALREKLKSCEEELYRIARQLDRVCRGGGIR